MLLLLLPPPRLLRLLTLLVVLPPPPAAEPLLPSLAPPRPLPPDFRCRRLDLLDDPPYRVRSAALVGAWEATAPTADGVAATAAAEAAEGVFAAAAAAAAPLRMKGFLARRATPCLLFLFPFPFSFAAPSHSPATSSLAEPFSEPDPALVDELPDDTLSPPSLSLRKTVRSAVGEDTAAAVSATPRPREERLVCAGSGGELGRARFLPPPPLLRVARGDAFDGEHASAAGADPAADNGNGAGVGDSDGDAAGGGVIALAAAAAPIAAISAPVEPQVGKSGLFSAGPVEYWKSSASLVKKRSSPVSGSSGKGSSSCSLRTGHFETCGRTRKGVNRGVYLQWDDLCFDGSKRVQGSKGVPNVKVLLLVRWGGAPGVEADGSTDNILCFVAGHPSTSSTTCGRRRQGLLCVYLRGEWACHTLLG